MPITSVLTVEHYLRPLHAVHVFLDVSRTGVRRKMLRTRRVESVRAMILRSTLFQSSPPYIAIFDARELERINVN
jgi:hypothetical protein